MSLTFINEFYKKYRYNPKYDGKSILSIFYNYSANTIILPYLYWYFIVKNIFTLFNKQ